ncbi:hypothetical protein RND81_12G097500 [Saponaria officinalis]|uniref:Uncharacterized protein n=1 Tax=Saponaria officinalis TaxID=3572 RepID=A0AAW1H8K8_SAPOF
MRDHKRCDFGDSAFDDDNYRASIYPKKRRTATICTVLSSGLVFYDNDTPRSSSVNEGSSYGEETESDSKNYAAKSRKTSKKRFSTLPYRFSDSVGTGSQRSKSKFADIEAGVHEIYLKRRDSNYNVNRNVNNKRKFGSYEHQLLVGGSWQL